jgi:Tol biopolymer transport system component
VTAALSTASASLLLAGSAGAAFPGEPGSLVFDLNDDIYTVAADGSHLRPLSDSGDQENDPAYSADGTHIAYVDEDLIVTTRADGTHLRILFLPGHDEHDGQPAWSPDGRLIAFVRSGRGIGNRDQSGVWVIPSRGGAPRLVTGGAPGDQFEPSWSSDGKWIAFLQVAPGRPPHLAKIRPDGTGLTVLTSGPRFDGSPDWSPNGKELVFVRWDGANGDVSSQELWTVSANGTGARPLTAPRFRSFAPAWSPDGRRIAFVSARKPTSSVFTIVVATGHVARLVGNVGDVGRISWQPLRGA